jgi:hypothetical protein
MKPTRAHLAHVDNTALHALAATGDAGDGLEQAAGPALLHVLLESHGAESSVHGGMLDRLGSASPLPIL